jgi:hypothetical protein
LIEKMLNSPLIFSLAELLPKDKTAVVGIATVNIGEYFIPWKSIDPVSDAEQISIPTQYSETIILYPEDGKREADKQYPELKIQVNVSRPIITQKAMNSGRFISILMKHMLPVPDEWTLKEPVEKDLNSSNFLWIDREKICSSIQ